MQTEAEAEGEQRPRPCLGGHLHSLPSVATVGEVAVGCIHRPIPVPGDTRWMLGLTGHPGTPTGPQHPHIDTPSPRPQRTPFSKMSFEFTASMGKELPGLAFKNRTTKT